MTRSDLSPLLASSQAFWSTQRGRARGAEFILHPHVVGKVNKLRSLSDVSHQIILNSLESELHASLFTLHLTFGLRLLPNFTLRIPKALCRVLFVLYMPQSLDTVYSKPTSSIYLPPALQELLAYSANTI